MSEHKTPHYIGGEWVAGSGEMITSINPATTAVLWQGKAATEAEVNHAVREARSNLPEWVDFGFEKRLQVVDHFRIVAEKHKAELAELIAMETGKPLWDSLNEAGSVVAKIAVSAKAYQERTGDYNSETQGIRTVLRHKPHGVVAVFGPYNFPAHLPNGHIVPALLAGNTVVLKPSEQTPLVAQRMMEYWIDAGLPTGVINLLQGGREMGAALANHAGIDGLYFTGSSAVGLHLAQVFASQPGKVLALEMGGNNPLIVHETENQMAAIYHIIQSAFMSSGQRCSCARRLIVPVGKEGDMLIKLLVEKASSIRVGAYNDTPEPFMGPLISNSEKQRLLEAWDHLVTQGGKALLAMRSLQDGLPFLSPGIVDVTEVKDRPDAEYFGPILQVVRVADFAAAIAEANNTRFGLTSGLLSDNKALYDVFYRHARAGVINWNRPTTGASSGLPFGGVGVSGNHRPSAAYAADYCAYPVASQESDVLSMPATLSPGLVW